METIVCFIAISCSKSSVTMQVDDEPHFTLFVISSLKQQAVQQVS